MALAAQSGRRAGQLREQGWRRQRTSPKRAAGWREGDGSLAGVVLSSAFASGGQRAARSRVQAEQGRQWRAIRGAADRTLSTIPLPPQQQQQQASVSPPSRHRHVTPSPPAPAPAVHHSTRRGTSSNPPALEPSPAALTEQSDGLNRSCARAGSAPPGMEACLRRAGGRGAAPRAPRSGQALCVRRWHLLAGGPAAAGAAAAAHPRTVERLRPGSLAAAAAADQQEEQQQPAGAPAAQALRKAAPRRGAWHALGSSRAPPIRRA
jgi:hypothetical protein